MATAHLDYENLTPRHEYLTDEAVLVQAWKKSHEYLRRHSWYADCLELDVSAVTLEDRIANWSELLSPECYRSHSPSPMQMVPAPKTCGWEIKTTNGTDYWQPKRKERGGPPLQFRPLAHLGIRDQTLATACMLCLANIVETAQGEPVDNALQARDRHVYSYGNRLLCRWVEGEAHHQWANAETYRRYYSDYQAFLARPQGVVERELPNGEFRIASLDLSKSYDRMSRAHLRQVLMTLVNDSDFGDTGLFFEILDRVMEWQWADADLGLAQLYQKHFLKDAPSSAFIEDGLPQGLVAAGFFANAYLIPFDRAIGALVGKELVGPVRLVDYCRYVDDLRLVVDCPDGTLPEHIDEQLWNCIEGILEEHAPGQKLNTGEKYSVVAANPHRESTPLAIKMQSISRELSRPLDQTNAGQALEILDGLMAFTRRPEDQGLLRNSGEEARRTYARFTTSGGDVPPDSVERFVAHRWRLIYRHLVLLADYETAEDSGNLNVSVSLDSREFLDKRASHFSTTLIGCWLRDPSKVRLLRIALDIYPDTKNLDTICTFLLGAMGGRRRAGQPVAYFTATYVASELLRAGATETGFVRYPELLARELDIGSFRNRLAAFADDCIRLSMDGRRRSLPPYLILQAALFLASNQRVSEELVAHVGQELGNGSSCYRVLSFLRGQWPGSPSCTELREVAAALLIARRLGLAASIGAGFVAQLVRAGGAHGGAQLLFSLWDYDQELIDSYVRGLGPEEKRACIDILYPCGYREGPPAPAREMTLADIVHTRDNPFSAEIPALHLARELLKAFSGDQELGTVDPNRVSINIVNRDHLCGDPSIPDSSASLTVHVQPYHRLADHRYSLPPWCPDGAEWKLGVGQLLRAAIVGKPDFTSFHQMSGKMGTSDCRYRPIRSSWFKRKYGLYFGRGGLGGAGAPVSLWIPGFLNELLHWPGAWRSTAAERLKNLNISGMLSQVERRLQRLGHQYGKACGVPVYDFPTFVGRPFSGEALTVAYVQSAFPRFDTLMGDPLMEKKGNRRTQRKHLSALLSLLDAMIRGHESKGSDEAYSPVDLLVFPELSIHTEDVKKLEDFAMLHKTIIFAGLVYSDRCRIEGELVNHGIWLLPDESEGHLQVERVWQGKANPIKKERDCLGVTSWRPYQALIPLQQRQENEDGDERLEARWAITAAICYDATQLELASDLVNLSDVFVVAALNQDVGTFDSMTTALNYHMFQHVMLVNSGEFGGSTIQAPYRERHMRTLLHEHGGGQIAVGITKIYPEHFLADVTPPDGFRTKTPPAGYRRVSTRFEEPGP